MANLIDSYKKVYEHKKAHIWLIIIAFVWTVLSTFYDMYNGNINNYRQNPIDLIFNIVIGAYSILFLHNSINKIDGGILSRFNNLGKTIFLRLIQLNIIWGIYAAIFLILTIVVYMLAHLLILPIVIITALVFIAMFIYYIFLAFAEDLEVNGLFNIKLIFKLIPATIKPLYKNVIIFLLFTLLMLIIYILMYVAAGLVGIDKIGNIKDDLYLFDFIMNTIASYIVIVTWYFAFPYSLIDSYETYAKPVLREEFNNGTDA